MNSRISLLALGLFVVGCGGGVETTPNTNRDPVTYCGGLSRADCAAATECYVEPLACIALCVDPDGSGNCQSPCASDYRCLAQPVSCEALDAQACEADSRCELEQYACALVCIDDGHGGCVPCATPPPTCHTRTPASCESLDVAACATDARCEVLEYACAQVCIDDGHGGCLPCNAPPASCRTREVSCYGLTPDACDARADCEFISVACACAPDALCDCPAIEPSCQPRSTPVSCYGLTPDECDQHSECEFVARNACACSPGAACDCPVIEPSCQPRSTPVSCFGLSPDECDVHAECEFVARNTCVCPPNAVCDCPVFEPSCQPRASCESLSASECVNVPGCGLLESDCGCTNEACDCGGEARCVSMTQPQPDPCAGLDLATCTTDARCEIGSLDCTMECRDDGNGGCLPCPDTAICQLRAEEPPVAGCGAPPPPSP